jgi:PAS domain S-box-containing protein
MRASLSQAIVNTGEPQFVSELEKALVIVRQDFFRRVLFISVLLALVGMLAGILAGDVWATSMYGLIGIAFYILMKLPHWSLRTRVVCFLTLLYLLAVLGLLRSGYSGTSVLFLAVLPTLAFLLIGRGFGITSVGLVLLTWLGAGPAFHSLDLSFLTLQADTWLTWFYRGIDLLWAVVVLILVQQQVRETQRALQTVLQENQDLQEMRNELMARTKQLDYERYLLHTLLDTVVDRISFKDLSGSYTRVSRAAAQQFGLPAEQVIGKTDFDFFADEYVQQVQAEEKAVLQSGEPLLDKVEREVWLDGRPETWSIASRMPLKSEDGKTVGLIGTARDITEIKQAQEADQRHAQQLSAIAEVGRAVTSNLDLKALLRVLVELLQDSFGFYGVNVWLLTEPPDTVQLKAGLSPEGQNLDELEIQLSMQIENSITSVCRSGDFYLDNELKDPAIFPLGDRFRLARSQLTLPLRIAEKIVGALELLSEKGNAFGEQDVILLRSLADQVTIAIRNATLYEGERSRRHFAERLYEVGRALSHTLKLDEVLDLILEQLDKIVPTDRAAIMLLDEENVLQFVAARGFPVSARLADMSVRLKDVSLYEQIFRSQKPISIPDVTQYPNWQEVKNLPQARSWMGVPLISGGEVRGMLSLTRESLESYSFSEATLAQTFAGQAAVALENARLYDNLERFSLRLEEMVQERTEQLSRAYAQLEQLDRTKSDFIKVTSHELRTPLTILSGYSQMLIQNEYVTEHQTLKQLANGIYSGTGRMQEIVNRMLDIAKIDSRSLELSPEPLSMPFLVKNVAGNFETALKQRRLTLDVQDLSKLPRVEADAGALHKVFYHLIGNAIKYTPDGGRITISGDVIQPEGDFPEGGAEIVISDTGIGIDPEFQELIFTKFYQTGEVALHSSGQTKFKGGGPGLGLPIVRGIIQAHGGKLWVESPGYDEESCPGSRFHVVLPIRQRISQ